MKGTVKPGTVLIFSLLLVGCIHGGGGGGGSSASNIEYYDSPDSFDGEVLTLYFYDGEGNEYTLNSAAHARSRQSREPMLPWHVGETLLLMEIDQGQTQLAYVVLNWDPDDPTDWLSTGWWLQTSGQLDLFESDDFSAFFTGPEFSRDDSFNLPTEGTATYTGSSGGLFQYFYGSDTPEFEGEYTYAEYEGPSWFTLDFSNQFLWGCVGCTGQIKSQQVHLAEILGPADVPPPDLSGYRIRLGPVRIKPDGTYENDILKVSHSEREVLDTWGYFGGALSARPDRDGNPRLMVGFYQGTFQEDDGGTGRFHGAYHGITEATEE